MYQYCRHFVLSRCYIYVNVAARQKKMTGSDDSGTDTAEKYSSTTKWENQRRFNGSLGKRFMQGSSEYATFITKTRLFKYIENFTSKHWNFSDKNSDFFFHISAENIDCGYSLEPPRRGGSNEYPQSMFSADIWKIMYIPVNPSFTI